MKIKLFAFALIALFAFSCEESALNNPQGIAADVPQCQDTATFEGWVLLSYVAEVHAPQGLPGGYTAVIKTPHFIKQTLPISFKESDAAILGRLKSPWPDQFLIGQVLPDYSLTKKYCKERTKPVPKVPDSGLSEYMQNRKLVLPDGWSNSEKQRWMLAFQN